MSAEETCPSRNKDTAVRFSWSEQVLVVSVHTGLGLNDMANGDESKEKKSQRRWII